MVMNINKSEKLSEIGEIVSQGETKIGEGFTATVHSDPENPDICYKVLKHIPRNGFMTASGKTVFVNNVSKEEEYLNKLHEIADEIKVPKPLYSIEVKDTDKIKDGNIFQVLAMERLNAYSFREIMEGKKNFPEKFLKEGGNFLKLFFRKVEKFVEKMHTYTKIYHRDLHTGNIMIDLEEGCPCVIDFGMSAKSAFRSSSDEEIYIERIPGNKKSYKMTKDEDFIRTNRKKFLRFIAPKLKNIQ